MRRHLLRRATASLAVCALALTACGGDVASENTTTAEAPAEMEQDLQTKPEFTVSSSETPPTELVIEDLVVGDGAEAVAGSNMSMHYVGKSWSTGEQFDASWDRGQTFEFRLGAGMVIGGWDQGIAGMKVGGRRMLTIPPALGYGASGAGGVIGPNETLVFVVDLLSVG